MRTWCQAVEFDGLGRPSYGGIMNRQEEFLVTFQPGDKKVYVLAGTRLQEAATAADLVLDAPCGGEGTCGKCRVIVSEGAAPPTAEERKMLDRRGTARRLPAGLPGNRRRTDERAGARDLAGRPALSDPGPLRGRRWRRKAAPAICKRYVELPLPDRGRRRAGPGPAATRRLGPVQADLSLVRELPGRLRDAHFQGTAVLDDDRLIDFEPGNTEWDSFGVAVDLGTTTLVAALLGPGHRPAGPHRFAAQSADPLRRRRADREFSWPAPGPTGWNSSNGPSSRPSMR